MSEADSGRQNRGAYAAEYTAVAHEDRPPCDEEEENVGPPADCNASTCRRQQCADMLERPDSSNMALAVHYGMSCLILLSTLLTILETVPEIRVYATLFFILDMVVTSMFTIEFALRVYTAVSACGFCTDILNILDFISVLPGYAELYFFLTTRPDNLSISSRMQPVRSLRNIRLLRLVRVVRIVRLVRGWRYARIYAQEVGILFNVMNEVTEASMALIFLLVGLATILTASLMYVFESQDCVDITSTMPAPGSLSDPLQRASVLAMAHAPGGTTCNARSDFDTIPSGFWWALATLTTVGYGDMVPSTPMGKVLGGITCVAGVMVISTAAALMSVHFQDRWQKEKAKADFRRYFADSPASLELQDELEGMVSELQDSADALLSKLAILNEGAGPTPMAQPMIRSINSHSGAFINGTLNYIYDVLFKVMLNAADVVSESDEPGTPMRWSSNGTPTNQ